MNNNMIRLFIAIEFSEDIKDELMKSSALIRNACERGSFTRRENMHITLVFLGEIASTRVKEITGLMDNCTSSPIKITTGHMGRFKRWDGDILWRKITADKQLFQLQKTLASRLRDQGFQIEDRKFVPHLTMTRRAILKDGIELKDLSEQMPDLKYTASKMTLMESKLVNGRTTYIPLHHSPFNK